RECDVAFHASGSAAGLAAALELAGEEASVIELSWYGTDEVKIPLGAAFHSRRLRIVSSQVGRVSPAHRARWTPHRRLAAALAPLNYRNLDALPQLKGANTTTEFLTKYVFDLLAEAVRKGELGRKPDEISAIRVTISESPSARAWYEASLR